VRRAVGLYVRRRETLTTMGKSFKHIVKNPDGIERGRVKPQIGGGGLEDKIGDWERRNEKPSVRPRWMRVSFGPGSLRNSAQHENPTTKKRDAKDPLKLRRSWQSGQAP